MTTVQRGKIMTVICPIVRCTNGGVGRLNIWSQQRAQPQKVKWCHGLRGGVRGCACYQPAGCPVQFVITPLLLFVYNGGLTPWAAALHLVLLAIRAQPIISCCRVIVWTGEERWRWQQGRNVDWKGLDRFLKHATKKIVCCGDESV